MPDAHRQDPTPRVGLRPIMAVAVRSAALVILVCVFGCSSAPTTVEDAYGYRQRGVASWYGEPFHGRKTASGEVYDMDGLTAAHRTLPLGTELLVTNLENARSVRVRVNDRGPFIRGRILDLSRGAAQRLGMMESGLAEVEVRGQRQSVVAVQPIRADAYSIQVGSFSVIENAEQLRSRLAGNYPEVRIIRRETGSGSLFRVQVGKFSSESRAERLARDLERSEGLSGFVVRDDG